MKTLLVPTDFSECAYNALVYACHLAEDAHYKIVLLNCYQIPAGQGNVLIDFKDILERDSIAGLKKVLDRIESDPAGDLIDFTLESYYGFLAEGAEVMVKKYNVDLIVMGTTGASSLAKRMFGSNASHLLRKITKPVLTVPENAKWSTWNHTLVATDFLQTRSGQLFSNLKLLTNGMHLGIDVVHVLLDNNTTRDFEKLESRFIASIGQADVKFHYVPAEDVVDGILNYTQKNECDVLVMMRRKQGMVELLFNTSATRSMSLHASKPVLILQE